MLIIARVSDIRSASAPVLRQRRVVEFLRRLRAWYARKRYAELSRLSMCALCLQVSLRQRSCRHDLRIVQPAVCLLHIQIDSKRVSPSRLTSRGLSSQHNSQTQSLVTRSQQTRSLALQHLPYARNTSRCWTLKTSCTPPDHHHNAAQQSSSPQAML